MADNKDKKVLNVPALRFPEFTEEWEKCKLGDITINFNLRNKDRISYPMYSVTNNRGFVPQSEQFEDREMIGEDIKAYKIIHKNDFAYNPARINVGSIAKYNGDNPCMISSLYVCFKSCNIVDADWLMQLLKTSKMNFYYNVNGEGGVRIYLFYPNFARISTSYPKIAEQKKIAKFLSLIDERIATQNKIIEDLRKLKSAIVEMLFCIQGGVLLKLGDIGSFVRGLTYSNEDITEDINATTVIRANNLNYGNNVNKEDVVYVNKKPTEVQILRKGDIVICMANGSSSLVGKNSYYSFDDRHSTIGAFCGVYRTSQPLVKWLMQSQRYKRLVYQSLQGGNGAIANLNGDDILNMTFRVVEQEKSVSILSTLGLIENSIAVNENLQELYSAQKVYLLRHLFI